VFGFAIFLIALLRTAGLAGLLEKFPSQPVFEPVNNTIKNPGIPFLPLFSGSDADAAAVRPSMATRAATIPAADVSAATMAAIITPIGSAPIAAINAAIAIPRRIRNPLCSRSDHPVSVESAFL
jgi:hypothetical protein